MLPRLILDAIIDRALQEDLAGGDLTTEACIDEQAQAVGEAVAKDELVVCGGEVFARCFERVDPGLRAEILQPDGARVRAGTILWRVSGRARSLLGAERVALNFAQRLAGVATLSARYVAAVPPGSKTRITDTRKTTPGLRPLERYAVRTGGAHNHRDDLGSAVLIKDNHLAAAGGVAAAVRRARERASHSACVEVEVASLAELDQALRAGVDTVLLDNMTPRQVAAAVRRVRAWRRGPRPLVEASGGVTLERVAELARAGVDAISVGALTHSAPAADISLELRLERS
ncbi:MAG: carboxylating nicotinate-nucleotide diphosphorylase [Deltaproteobacteria bacterium]|nr:carboxylating nicotinate-nucleotide diphosphorylase [Deltaproteobacteria bacterium]